MSSIGALMNCYCGSLNDFLNCCEPFLKGISYPETAEALIRSRFSAFALKEAKYIQNTMKDPAFSRFNVQSFLVDSTDYLSLDIISSELGSQLDDIGFVTFNVGYKEAADAKQLLSFIERSTFHKLENRWYYVDGEIL